MVLWAPRAYLVLLDFLLQNFTEACVGGPAPKFVWNQVTQLTLSVHLNDRLVRSFVDWFCTPQVPVRRQKPDPHTPLDIMVAGLCPNVGDGVLRLRWKTKKHVELKREWTVDRALPGEVVELKFGLVRELRCSVLENCLPSLKDRYR